MSGFRTWGEGCSGIGWWRLGMLLNTRLGMGRGPTTENYPAVNVRSVKAEAHCPRLRRSPLPPPMLPSPDHHGSTFDTS